ncbi:MAG: SEC-C domain-containing protein [Micromonosporaceae bacterium]|nr:SEC-C domain-containing protein [Micromonosporaceae bacterium]
MPFEPLTRADLDEIAHSLSSTSDPFAVVGGLLDAVDTDRIADPGEISYALLLAAEVYQRSGDLEAAEALASRAVVAHQTYGEPAQSFPRAYRAGLRLRLGQDEAALAELSELRTALVSDPTAIAHITQALEDGGYAQLAERWVTEALQVALARQVGGVQSTGHDEAADRAAFVVYTLAQRRSQLRADRGLPPDAYDQLAGELRAGLGQALAAEEIEDDPEGTAVLFWPRADFEQLLALRPGLATAYGADWDQHRMMLEWGLVRLAECGKTGLAVLVGSVADLMEHARLVGGDFADLAVRDSYLDEGNGQLPEIEWPPGRNSPCWCGSGQLYRQCCQPRPPEA